MHMILHLNKDEACVAVAALRTLNRRLADDIGNFGKQDPGEPQQLQITLDQRGKISSLMERLATDGHHDVAGSDVELTLQALDYYLRLLGMQSRAEDRRSMELRTGSCGQQVSINPA